WGRSPFPEKFDKSGILVRKYCWLASQKVRVSPYLAPRSVQQNAGCIIGRDYPLPMLGEKVEKERCIQRMKAAYALGLYGNHPSVLNGSADAMFHPGPTSDDRISCGKKKLGKRRRHEEWGDYPERNKRRPT
ncbi:hypothetical protein EV363DRAFT_1155988, partial [Boletus edulis]